jgi:hypothetical protein
MNRSRRHVLRKQSCSPTECRLAAVLWCVTVQSISGRFQFGFRYFDECTDFFVFRTRQNTTALRQYQNGAVIIA